MLAVTSCNSYGLDEGVESSSGAAQGRSQTSPSSALPPLPYSSDRGPQRRSSGSHSRGHQVRVGRESSNGSLGGVSSENSSDMSAGPGYLAAMMDEKVVPISNTNMAVLPAPVRNKEGLQPLRDPAPHSHTLFEGGGLSSARSTYTLPVLGAELSKMQQGTCPPPPPPPPSFL